MRCLCGDCDVSTVSVKQSTITIQCMDGRHMVSEVDFLRNTGFGVQVHKFSLECAVTAKIEPNVVQMLCYHLLGVSTCYIAQTCSYDRKFKTRLRFDHVCTHL